MMKIPEKGTIEYEKMQGRLGESALEFVLEMARQLNAHIENHPHREPQIGFSDFNEFSSSVNPPEVKDAGIQTEG